MNKFILAIPFYKNENFIDEIIGWYKSKYSLLDVSLIKEIIIYNDCPLSEDSLYLENRCNDVGFKYILNTTNLGYLKTVNFAYAYAKNQGLSLVLLNSDVIPIPGFLMEINKCFESDSMLGVVSARSNNATICNLYDSVKYYDSRESLTKYEADHSIFTKYTPAISYAPVVTGFCFAIKNNIIKIFSGFDEIYTVGYEEENDFCLRISERGFRIGIANRAFVAHMEGQSFKMTSSRESLRNSNANIIRNKYPYYDKLIQNHSDSLLFNAEAKIKRSLDNRVRYIIDARVLSPCHNGSNKLIIEFLKGLASLNLSVDVVAEPYAIEFHKTKFIDNINIINKVNNVYEFGIMLGQPMHHSALFLIPLHSVVSTCIFFDTIAHDCPQLRSENYELDNIWSTLPYVYSDISFISHHSKVQFELKFGSGTANLHTHLLPLEFKFKSVVDGGKHNNTVLVFGNKFTHKGIDLLFDELPRNNDITYYVLGHSQPSQDLNVIFLNPGVTQADELDKLMSSVDYMIMPSFAEGFGFPLLEAVSHEKPIYCREINCYKEIIAALPDNKKHLIKIVTDFKSCTSQVPIIHNQVNRFDSYQEYSFKILSDIEKKESEDFFNKFKSRILLLNKYNNETSKFVKLSIFKKIYRMLLGTAIAPIAIKIKKFINKSSLLMSSLS